AGPPVRGDETSRRWGDDRAEVRGRTEARQGDPGRGREGATDAARRRSHHLVTNGHALWLRRVHPARGLARDASRGHADPALARDVLTQRGNRGGRTKAPLPRRFGRPIAGKANGSRYARGIAHYL